MKRNMDGFRPQRGTRDAITFLKVIIQRAVDVNRNVDVLVCFIYYEKAFHKVNHTKIKWLKYNGDIMADDHESSELQKLIEKLCTKSEQVQAEDK